MNKKLISIGLTVIMSLTVLSGLASATASNGVPAGFGVYTIPIIVKNYTIPNDYYNYTGYVEASTPNVISTKYTPAHTLMAYYYGTNGELDSYNYKTGQFTPLTSFLKPNATSMYILVPNQLTNGSINIIGDVYNDSGKVEFDYYNFYNNTNVEYLTSISFKSHVLGLSFSDNYFYFSYDPTGSELYNTWINLTTYKYYYLNFSTYDVNSVNYFNAGKSWFFTQNQVSNATLETTIFNYSEVANSFEAYNIYTYDSAINHYDYNNEPFIETKLVNGTYLLDGLQANWEDGDTYFVSLMYYNVSTNKYNIDISYNTFLGTTNLINYDMYDQNGYDINGNIYDNTTLSIDIE